jgi:peptidoglycan/xylan/chitin deacetylase (PgdA/CDA1 family)
MNTTPEAAGQPGGVPSRRVLLRAGGLVILTGFGVADPVLRSQAATRDPSQPADPAQPMYYIHDGRKRVALTIDDGPSPVYTPEILRLLHRYKITAAFSMIGVNVDAHPGVAREVAEAGHMIVNHTWTHPDLALMSSAAIRDEMVRGTEAIHRVTGRRPHMFRAPYGAWSPTVLEWCEHMRMTPLDWSVDPRDWSRPGVPAIVGNIMDNTRTGSIILEHDGGGDRSQTVAALKVVLPRLLAEGFHFRTPY